MFEPVNLVGWQVVLILWCGILLGLIAGAIGARAGIKAAVQKMQQTEGN